MSAKTAALSSRAVAEQVIGGLVDFASTSPLKRTERIYLLIRLTDLHQEPDWRFGKGESTLRELA